MLCSSFTLPTQVAFRVSLLASLLAAGYAQAEENNVLAPTDQGSDVQQLEQELSSVKQELTALKNKPKWNVEAYLGTEQEINSDDDWKFQNGSLATSPYLGAFIYQDGSPWMYDVQFLKTYIDHNSEYNRNRFSLGVTRTMPFNIEGKSGSVKMRVGYRNDSYHWGSINKASLAAPDYKGDLRKGEERNEIWLRPALSYNYSANLNLMAAFSFRIIDRELDYARAQGEYGVTTRDWSTIDEHLLGGTYKFNASSSLSAYYLYVREKLVRTMDNEEHFAWVTYRHKIPSGQTIAPYVRYALADSKTYYFNSDKDEINLKRMDRTRFGLQLTQPISPATSLMFDIYYRPETVKDRNAATTTDNNFILWYMELKHKF
ncbi:MAG: hypothetical protein ACRCYV_08510 [Aeromonas sp.]